SARSLQQRLQRASRALPPNLDPQDRELLEEARRDATAYLEEVVERGATRTVPARVLFELDDPTGTPSRPGRLMTRLKALGVNPAGSDVLYQEFFWDAAYHPWTDLFDFSSPDGEWNAGLPPAATNGRERLREKV